MRIVILSLWIVVTATVVPCPAENWPGWRGPRGDGSSLETNVPIDWDGETGRNIAWKTALPGEGHGSPVVWEDRIFLVSCRTETSERILTCVDRASGRLLWDRTVVTSPLETKHALNSHASSTPATDGERVYVAFLEVDGSTRPATNVGKARPVTPGKMVVAAYDFEGELLWKASPGPFSSVHGFCSNPVLFEELVIVNGDHDGESWVAGLDRSTGKTVWSTPREYKTRSYVTPLVRYVDGRDQLVFSGSKSVVSLDPRTGKTHWSIEGPTEQFVASMVFDGDRFFMAAGFPTYHVMAIRPDGQGDVTKTHVDWHVTTAKCYVPSPVVIGKYLLVADDRGTANCFDTATGERFWQERLGKHFSASLVSAQGRAYFMADDGLAKIVEPGAELKVVGECALGEYSYASPAISQGHVYLRGERHLYAIGPQVRAAAAEVRRE